MSYSTDLETIRRYEYKLKQSGMDNWIRQAEPPTAEETQAYKRACKRVYGVPIDISIKRLKYNIGRYYRALKHGNYRNKAMVQRNIINCWYDLYRLQSEKAAGQTSTWFTIKKVAF